jgi:acyl-CoA synthetase (AMP-forming)/AMP-acid ligase II
MSASLREADAVWGAETIWDLVAARSELSYDCPMLRDAADRMITFGDFAASAEQIAAGLYSIGVDAGTPVTWQVPTTIETIVLSAALARLRALQNPILHIYRQREVTAAVAGTRPRIIIIEPEWRGVDYAAMTESVLATLGYPPARWDGDGGDPDGDGERPIVLNINHLPIGNPSDLPPATTGDKDEVRWIYYTSGTTSEPKGVKHTDGTLLAGGKGLALALQLSNEDIGSIAFPFAHIAGPDYLVAMLLCGFQAVVLEAFVPAEAAETFRHCGVTMAGGSTAFYQAFLAEQRKSPGVIAIPTLRALSGGGAPKPPELFTAVLDEMGIRIVHGYGMTEIPMISMGSLSDTDEQLMSTEGAPVTGAEIRIRAADGEIVATGTDGEVVVHGPMVCKGYTDAGVTEESFEGDGWFRTGDVGHLREDGHLVLTGRLKDVIIRKGENISAREIEELTYSHPKVSDVAVIGLPDAERGERVCAVVELAPGAETLTLEELADYLTSMGLMRQKLPEQLEILDSLPRNESLRKVLKYKLREQFGGSPP